MRDIIIATDCDYTLVNERTHLSNAINKGLMCQGVPFEHDFTHETDIEQRINQEIKEHKINPELFWIILNKYDSRVEGIRNGTIKLFPETIEFLEALKSYDKRGIISNTPLEKALPEISMLGIDRYFDSTKNLFWTTPGFYKPNLDYTLQFLKGFEYKKGKVVIIGDGASDMNAADNLRVLPQYEVCSIHIKRNGGNLNADYTITDLRQALPIIEKFRTK
jgi:phosphoglycolate phosphatase-like HAD superfamily hydrolase